MVIFEEIYSILLFRFCKSFLALKISFKAILELSPTERTILLKKHAVFSKYLSHDSRAVYMICSSWGVFWTVVPLNSFCKVQDSVSQGTAHRKENTQSSICIFGTHCPFAHNGVWILPLSSTRGVTLVLGPKANNKSFNANI